MGKATRLSQVGERLRIILTVTLFPSASAVPRDLFPSRAALIFHQDLVESERCTKSSPVHPKDSDWCKRLDSGGSSVSENDVSHSLNRSFMI